MCFTIDFPPARKINYPENSSHAMEMHEDPISKSNYDILCRRSEAEPNEYFVGDIGTFYNEANAYSETNQRRIIDNDKLECESLAAGNVRPNVWTTHLNCDALHSVATARPIFDGKRFYFFCNAFYYIRANTSKRSKRMR